MPLTATGNEVMASMQKQYGTTKGKSVFYASINAKKSGSSKWHKKKKKAGKYTHEQVKMAKGMA
jgi:hypothetical protein